MASTSSRGWVSTTSLKERRAAEAEREKTAAAEKMAAEMLDREEKGAVRARKAETGEGTWINPALEARLARRAGGGGGSSKAKKHKKVR